MGKFGKKVSEKKKSSVFKSSRYLIFAPWEEFKKCEGITPFI